MFVLFISFGCPPLATAVECITVDLKAYKDRVRTILCVPATNMVGLTWEERHVSFLEVPQGQFSRCFLQDVQTVS